MLFTLATTLACLLVTTAHGAVVSVTVSNQLPNVYADGVRLDTLNHDNYLEADHVDVSDDVRLIAVQGMNVLEGCSGVMVAVRNSSYGYTMVSDRVWKCSSQSGTGWMNLGFDDSTWPEAYEVAPNNVVADCPFIPLPAFPSHANWIWSPNYIEGDIIIHCRGYTSVCAFQPCQNGATCQMNDFELCRCPPHYTGVYCETAFDVCESNPCLNSGICEYTDDGYFCNCGVGFTGDHCETDITDCASNPCQNGATCVFDIVGGYLCSCPDGYTGEHCETMINYCESEPCQNDGTCIPILGGATCTCAPGFTGGFCQIQINFCESNPCMNAATCVPGINMYTCQCNSGWSGVHCETAIEGCATNPCMNGGTCTLDGADGSVQCICFEGWYGPLCELTFDFCESFPCLHGSTCVPYEGGYTCNCRDGYLGDRCESVIPNCGSIMLESSYDAVRGFSILCEVNILEHPLHVSTPCRDLLININHYNTSDLILASGGSFGCFVTRFPDEMANGACINNYNQDQTLSNCLSCTHMGVCIRLTPPPVPSSKQRRLH